MNFLESLSSYKIKMFGDEYLHPIANNILYIYDATSNTYQQNPIAKELEAYISNATGLTNFEPLSHGLTSIVASCGEDVLRLQAGFVSRPKTGHMLQAEFNGNYKNFGIEILEKLNTKNISWDDVLEITYALKKDGYLFNDLGKDNIGRNKNGELQVLDPGSISPDDGKQESFDRLLADIENERRKERFQL